MNTSFWRHALPLPIPSVRRPARKVAERVIEHQYQHAPRRADGWNPAQLEAACRTMAASPAGPVPRIHVIFPCPQRVGGAIVVLRYARALADEFGLQVRCDLCHDLITVTFERAEAAQ